MKTEQKRQALTEELIRHRDNMTSYHDIYPEEERFQLAYDAFQKMIDWSCDLGWYELRDALRRYTDGTAGPENYAAGVARDEWENIERAF